MSQALPIHQQIKLWARELGFADCGISDLDLAIEEPRLQAWLTANYHGSMHYMATHGMMRARPAELQPGTLRVISVVMDYLPPQANFATNLQDATAGYISRYALGRDYHKLIRQRLKQLAEKIKTLEPQLGYRPFVDSAPILERPLAQKAGLGFIGKNSLLLHKDHGSWRFIGELLVDIALPIDVPATGDCGSCVACLTMCPTQAIVAPYVVDARRCISYLTIESDEDIPLELRSLLGNRIYGCDDCQLVCPPNRHAPLTIEADFQRRDVWLYHDLLSLFAWSEQEFLQNTEGSAIRRIGFRRWQRNIAVALGNAPANDEIIAALQNYQGDAQVLRHAQWALTEQLSKRQSDQQQSTIQLEKALRKNERLIRIVRTGLTRDA